MYMLYTVIGSLFLIIFGVELAYNVLWLADDEGWVETEPLQGHPITYNLTGHIVPIVSDIHQMMNYLTDIPIETVVDY